jgi:hypothetical protein
LINTQSVQRKTHTPVDSVESIGVFSYPCLWVEESTLPQSCEPGRNHVTIAKADLGVIVYRHWPDRTQLSATGERDVGMFGTILAAVGWLISRTTSKHP